MDHPYLEYARLKQNWNKPRTTPGGEGDGYLKVLLACRRRSSLIRESHKGFAQLAPSSGAIQLQMFPLC